MYSLVLLSLVASVVGQAYGPPPGPPPSGGSSSASPSSSSAAATVTAPPNTNGHINVNVGPGGQFIFSPNNITASNGTVVTFFFPGDIPHSVTQSSFQSPCTHLTGGNGTGFDSGLQTNKQFSITIEDDSQPIWFHCKQILHCGMGMVGAINAPTTGNNTLDAFTAAAKQIGNNEQTETDNGPVTGGVNAIATAPPAATVSASAPSSSSGSGSSGNSSGAGRITVGALGLAAVSAFTFFLSA